MFKSILPLALVTLAFSFPVKGGTRVIVNNSVSDSVANTRTLSRIYAMQLKTWKSGQAIKVFVLPSKHKIHREFSSKQLKMPAHQLDRLWNRLLFTGTGRIPEVVNSENEMLEKVRLTPGSIGYVDQNMQLDGVKVLNLKVNNE